MISTTQLQDIGFQITDHSVTLEQIRFLKEGSDIALLWDENSGAVSISAVGALQMTVGNPITDMINLNTVLQILEMT